jgi:signal transduction histidine kinase
MCKRRAFNQMSTRRAIEKVAPVLMAVTALILALAISSIAAWLLVRGVVPPPRGPVPSTPQGIAALKENPFIRSYTIHLANGQELDRFTRSDLPAGFAARVAARLAPPEVTCDSRLLQNGTQATLCTESSFAPLVPRVRQGLALIAWSSLAALILGWLAGMFVARSMTAPLRRMTELMGRVSRESAYSLRADAAGGEQGRLAAATNELLAQMQEHDLVFRRRSLELEAANKDLESFAFTVSHDLRAPLGSIDGFTQALEADYHHLFDDAGREYMSWIREGCRQMRELIDGLLQMARLTRHEIQRETVDLSGIARSIADSLQQTHPERAVRFQIHDGVRTVGDERLLRAVLENLMGNAFKFTRKREDAAVEFGARDGAYYVRDNGAGFDPVHAAKMFRPFQRLHSSREFEGTGIGLATVAKIVERHGGRAWAEGEIEKGATVYFTTGEPLAG